MKFKNLEMSKKIVYAVALLVVVLLPVVIIVSCVTGDTQPLTNYVIGVFGLASISVGFYYWKAKNENLNKYAIFLCGPAAEGRDSHNGKGTYFY